MQNWLYTTPIAHRGLHSDDDVCPENSIKAFSAAITAGYPIELDIQVIADGTVIVFHDDSLERMCGIKKTTHLLRKDELSSCFLKGSKETIPTLQQVFSLVAGKVPILIEIKETRGAKKGNTLVKTILDSYQYPFAIQSFNPFILGWFARNASGFTRGQLSSAFDGHKMFFLSKILLSSYFFNFISQPNFIAHNVKNLPTKKVESLRKKGMIVLGWTVRSQETAKEALCWSDNIIFEGFKTKLMKGIHAYFDDFFG